MNAFRFLSHTRAGIITLLLLATAFSPWGGQSSASSIAQGSIASLPVQGDHSANETSQGNLGQPSTSLEKLLNLDGTLDLSGSFSGSLDPTGWEMVSQKGEAPRFVRSTAAGKSGTERMERTEGMAAKPQFQSPPLTEPGQSPPQSPMAGGDENWDGTFGALGMNNDIHAIAVSGITGNVYVGGVFTTAGGVAANFIAMWNGSAWSALGSGMDNSVIAIAISGNGDVYAGGNFTTAGGAAANYIAKWNGSAWSALGTGVDYIVNAIAISGNGDVYVGGNFTTAGGVAANYIAKWNGSAWSALGSGMTNYVFALAISGNGDVYAGGFFTTAGGVAANYIAKWNGSAWSALGSGMNNHVRAIAISGNGDVYAGGNFTTAGGAAANYIAKWNGSAWSALGSGMNNGLYAIAASGADVYAGGVFTTAGGVAANYIAKWDGSAWSALGSGVNRSVYAIAISGNGAVNAGGYFTTAGGNPSIHFGIWREPACVTDPNYLVLSSTGATIVPGNSYVSGSTCNSCTVNVPLPFSYSFYGTPYSQVSVSNKGVVQFASNNSDGNNTCLPNASFNDAIFAYWDDLNTNINDAMGMFTSVSGVAPNRIFNIEWRAGFVANDTRPSFEVRLYEGQPKFEVIYGPTRGGFSATVGVQKGTGERFTQYACNTNGSVPNGTKLTFDQRVCSGAAGLQKP